VLPFIWNVAPGGILNMVKNTFICQRWRIKHAIGAIHFINRR
jgi:hypothetical protein